MDNNILIKLLEQEMQEDVKNIDFPANQEDNLTLADVKQWYCEAEKVIRVLANILGVPMNQAINQLRYAGHHILKAQTVDDNPEESVANLVEAFKHCKRAVYDSLDFYVYTLNDRYMRLMPYLDGQNAIKLESILHQHIRSINNARGQNENRIDYYQQVQQSLIDGLKCIEQINEIQRETGVAKELHINKKSMIDENHRLKHHVHILNIKNEELKGKIESRFSFLSIALALILTIGVSGVVIWVNTKVTTSHQVTLTTISPAETN